MRERTAVVFAALVVLSSVAPAVAAQPRSADAPAALDAGQDDIRQQSAPPDPEGDRIGWEGG
jgi:Spy/CpxP family protein refolding chaperone